MTNDGNNQYLYDGEGRICAVANTVMPSFTTYTGYLYDADGTRIAKGTITSWSCDPTLNGFQTTKDYILGLGGEQVTEMAFSPASPANSALTWQHTNIWAGGKLLGTYDKDGLHFYLDDPLGTRRAQTDYAGNLEQTCSSLPYGDGLACSGGNLQAPTEHHFTGKERDTESGNDYFEARYYSSAMGRFMSPDWSAKEEPVPYAKLENPQTLNLYGYVGNNPLVREDIDGHDGILLNRSYGAQGYGHNATLVGNDKHNGKGSGWVYFSKDGRSGGNSQQWFATFADFQKSDAAKTYNRAFRVSTSDAQDQKMIKAGTDNINKDYSVKEEPNKDPKTGKETGGNKAENCADLSATVLDAGGIKIGKHKDFNLAVGGSFTGPNKQYDAVVNDNKKGQSVTPCVGSDCHK
jgi:RHS repeat-associated protein